VPIYLDANTLATEHLAVLAMTGSGKSYTVGRIIERLVALMNGSVIVFDPHGEYGRALLDGRLNFNPHIDRVEDGRDRAKLVEIQERLGALQAQGTGIVVYTPQDPTFDAKYGSTNRQLALQFDQFEMDELTGILPDAHPPRHPRHRPDHPLPLSLLPGGAGAPNGLQRCGRVPCARSPW
jgi:hypothetical protein